METMHTQSISFYFYGNNAQIVYQNPIVYPLFSYLMYACGTWIVWNTKQKNLTYLWAIRFFLKHHVYQMFKISFPTKSRPGSISQRCAWCFVFQNQGIQSVFSIGPEVQNRRRKISAPEAPERP